MRIAENRNGDGSNNVAKNRVDIRKQRLIVSDSQAYTPAEYVDRLRDAQKDVDSLVDQVAYVSALAVYDQLTEFIDKLARNSSNRYSQSVSLHGVGGQKSSFSLDDGRTVTRDRPIHRDDADNEVVIEEDDDGGYTVYSKNYVFNLLDRGRDEIVVKQPLAPGAPGNYMRFPRYEGELTRIGETKINQRAKLSGGFVTVSIVDEIKPHKFLETILEGLRLSKSEQYLKIRTTTLKKRVEELGSRYGVEMPKQFPFRISDEIINASIVEDNVDG